MKLEDFHTFITSSSIFEKAYSIHNDIQIIMCTLSHCKPKSGNDVLLETHDIETLEGYDEHIAYVAWFPELTIRTKWI